MFRNARSTARDPLLPTSGNGRYGGGGSLYGAAKRTRPILSTAFIGTMVWSLASVGLIYWGRMYCARRALSSTFTCNHYMCKFEDKIGDTIELTSIPRGRLVRADMVRVRNGEIVGNYTKLKRAVQRKLGHSYAIVYTEPDSEDDDDESYDSYEDDDDSYDSYDDKEDSSEDGDGNEPSSGDKRTAIPPRKGTPAGKPGGRGSNAAPKVSQEEKEAAARKKAEEKQRYMRERDAKRTRDGRPPLREPDEPRRITPEMFARTAKEDGELDGQDDRFPGDAGTIEDKYRDKAAIPSQADMMQKAKADMKARAWERKRDTSPDDPDNKPPPPKLTPELLATLAEEEGEHNDPDDRFPGDAGTMEDKYRDKDQLTNRDPEGAGNLEMRNGGGRQISSVGGMEELEESFQGLNIAKDDAIGTGRGGETGGAGGRRKLFAAKPVKKDVSPPPPKKTKQEIQEDAKKAREVHRKGHGHHNKRARKVARTKTIEEEEAEELGEAASPPAKTVHHHKGFHHSDTGYVPDEDRYHVHHRYHQGTGEEKVKDGWKHQNRQWHEHAQLKKLGTRFSLGRSKARERKLMIDKYARKEIHKVEFTDSKRWSAGGVWMMILGVVSSAFCLVVGDFQPRGKTKKLS